MTRKRTEEELLAQEKFDRDIYESTRALFEQTLFLFKAAVTAGDTARANELQGVLIENYNMASKGSERLMGLLRRAENKG